MRRKSEVAISCKYTALIKKIDIRNLFSIQRQLFRKRIVLQFSYFIRSITHQLQAFPEGYKVLIGEKS